MLIRNGLTTAFVTLILLSAFPYGSARDWAWLLVLAGLSALSGLMLWRQPSLLTPATRPLWFWPAILSALALVGALLQWLPVLPEQVSHPLWHETSALLGKQTYHSISLNPVNSAHSWLRLVLYALLLFVALHLFRTVAEPKAILFAIIGATTFYAVYGLIFYLLDSSYVLFTRKWTHIGDLTGPFMNRNNYATFAGMGFLVSLGATLNAVRFTLRPMLSWRQRLRARLDHLLQGRVVILLLTTVTLFSTVLLSHSRAGIVATLAGAFVLILLLRWRWVQTHGVRASVLLGLGAVLSVVAIEANPVLWSRLMHTDLEREHRLYVYERSMAIIKENPFLGSGLNTFLETYRLHNAPPVDRSYDRALNEYLDMGVEHGVIGASLLLLSVLWLVWQCWRGYQRRQRGRLYPVLGLATSVQMGLHAGFDASPHVPAVALLYILILGLALGQSLPSSRQSF